MDKPLAPIFIIDGLDVGIFASLADVLLHLEPIDVKNGGFVAYDAEGRLIRLTMDGSHISASLAEDQPNHAAELETSLREYLQAVNEPIANDPTCDLNCLVNACRKFISASPIVSTRLKMALRKLVSPFRKQ